ncbi:protein root UVB sensitive 4-like isoform X1 [Primulina eburnea]|uniref:protein root UVB sensitive 4-like isoform X1 n=1 Tax=Primulina eburnea TaxID=1245227 RepID=UPI003C6BFD41
MHRMFASSDNLDEVSAKSQIQTVCFDSIALLLTATLNIRIKNNQRLLAALPFVACPIFSAVDLFGIYQGLKHAHLQTLTKDRLELIMKTWIELGYVPSPAQVSKVEGVGFLHDSDEAWRYCPSESVVLCIWEGAVTSDIIMGLFQACYIRKGLNVVDWENVFEACDSSDSVI